MIGFFTRRTVPFVQTQSTIQTTAFKVTYSSQIQHSHFLWEEEELVILKHSSWTHIHSEHMTEVSLVFLQRQWEAQAESTTCEAAYVTRFPGLSFLLYKMGIAAGAASVKLMRTAIAHSRLSKSPNQEIISIVESAWTSSSDLAQACLAAEWSGCWEDRQLAPALGQRKPPLIPSECLVPGLHLFLWQQKSQLTLQTNILGSFCWAWVLAEHSICCLIP